jgi:signal transduction histidine kinase
MLSRRIALRIALIAALTSAAAALLLLFASWSLARELATERIAALAIAVGTPRVVEHCSAGAFTGPGEIHYRLFAPDGTARVAGEAPLEAELLARLLESDAPTEFDMRRRESRVLFRVPNAPEACSLVSASWHPRASTRGLFLVLVSALLSALVGLGAWLVHALVARPLIHRLQRLRDAARAVGTSAYLPAPTWPDEAGEIGQALDAADARAKARANEEAAKTAALANFLADVSHDVRTPLASLALSLDEIAEEAPPEALPALTRALNEVVYLRSLTANLSLANRLRDGWLPSATGSRIDLAEVAMRVVLRCEPFALRRGIDFEHTLERPAWVRGDELASEQALTNLVENAIAHGEEGTRVALRVQHHEGRIRVVVEDNGPGVAESELSLLTERNYRTEQARTRNAQGTGLGLAITREVCERAGWAITFSPAQPRGLRVVVEADTER